MIPKSTTNGIEGIVLDAVGTLIEPYPAVSIAYAAAASRQGVQLDPGEVKQRFHQHFRHDEIDDLKGPLRTDEDIEWRRWRRIVGAVLPEVSDRDRAFAELWDHFGQPDAWRVFPDAAAAVMQLAERGIPIQIGSNFDRRLRTVVAGMPALRAIHEAGSLVISSEIGYRKPHADFYRIACERLGLPADRVLWVGDDVENDVRGPQRAGVRGVLVDRRGTFPEKAFPRVSDLQTLAQAMG